MASFSDAPTEVIDQVMKYLPRSDLPSVCLASKSLRCSAEPFLYSTVSLEWDLGEFPPIAPLLATLIRRPELFKHIDVVSLEGIMRQGVPLRPMDTSNISFDKFEAAIKKTKLSFSDISARTCIYALAALLIASLSRTTHLTITTPWINGQLLVGQVLQAKILGQLPTFERLRELRYLKRRDITYPENNMIFGETIRLFYLPTVTHLDVIMTNPETFQWPAGLGEPNLDHLTSLKIGWLCEPFLAKIFALTRNLESLEWSWEHHGPPHPWETTIMDFDKITETLQPLKDTLRSFEFTMHLGKDDELGDMLDMTYQGNFRHLRNFTRLTHLQVLLTSCSEADSAPLALADFVPDSAEVITLPGLALNTDWLPCGWDEDFFDIKDLVPIIEAVADARPSRLPRLQSIVILDGTNYIVRRRIGHDIIEFDLGFEVRFYGD
ncbi:unnamed protein product [Clonostachys rosea]|uniref:F-box domain-containing protein n=1 Tax=Bionectria ochroleuca TaxID=29856 RepID=A0ABY6UA96_BIOOC|nr:unnamed protein product [Clonostachys rosea]